MEVLVEEPGVEDEHLTPATCLVGPRLSTRLSSDCSLFWLHLDPLHASRSVSSHFQWIHIKRTEISLYRRICIHLSRYSQSALTSSYRKALSVPCSGQLLFYYFFLDS